MVTLFFIYLALLRCWYCFVIVTLVHLFWLILVLPLRALVSIVSFSMCL